VNEKSEVNRAAVRGRLEDLSGREAPPEHRFRRWLRRLLPGAVKRDLRAELVAKNVEIKVLRLKLAESDRSRDAAWKAQQRAELRATHGEHVAPEQWQDLPDAQFHVSGVFDGDMPVKRLPFGFTGGGS
jgi:hypothetical protein